MHKVARVIMAVNKVNELSRALLQAKAQLAVLVRDKAKDKPKDKLTKSSRASIAMKRYWKARKAREAQKEV